MDLRAVIVGILHLLRKMIAHVLLASEASRGEGKKEIGELLQTVVVA